MAVGGGRRRAGAEAFFEALPAFGVVEVASLAQRAAGVSLADGAVASTVVGVFLDDVARGGVGQFDQAVPGVVFGGVCFGRVVSLRDGRHVAVGVIRGSRPSGAGRGSDGRDRVDLARRSSLLQVPRSIAVVVLLELTPVTGGVEAPVLLELQRGDAAAAERASFGVGQAVERVVGVFLIPEVIRHRRRHEVLPSQSIADSVVGVLDSFDVRCRRGRILPPVAVDDPAKAVQAGVDVAGIGIGPAVRQHVLDVRLRIVHTRLPDRSTPSVRPDGRRHKSRPLVETYACKKQFIGYAALVKNDVNSGPAFEFI